MGLSGIYPEGEDKVIKIPVRITQKEYRQHFLELKIEHNFQSLLEHKI